MTDYTEEARRIVDWWMNASFHEKNQIDARIADLARRAEDRGLERAAGEVWRFWRRQSDDCERCNYERESRIRERCAWEIVNLTRNLKSTASGG